MADYHLIISNPPHSGIRASAVAQRLGLTPAEVRMKANYPVPEIWFADVSRSESQATREALEEAKFRVVQASGRELADIPAQEHVRSFSFSESGLQLKLASAELTLPYDAPLVAVYCQPRRSGAPTDTETRRDSLRDSLSHGSLMSGGPARRSSAESGTEPPSGDSGTFLDIYAAIGTRLRRISILQDEVDFSGLHMKLPRATDNMALLMAECTDRFPQATIDKRLVGTRVRQRLTVASRHEGRSRRKGYSYATKALGTLLEQIARSLGDASQNDLSSRLVYLTHKS